MVKPCVMDNLWSVIAGGFVAILGSVATPIFLDKSRRKAERLSLASAILGEIEALDAICAHRKFIEGIKQQITLMEADPNISRIFHFSVRRNPMRVYEANLSQIGVLPHPLPKQIVTFYAGVSSILEDIDDMREGKTKRNPEESLRAFKNLLELFEKTLALGQQIIRDTKCS